MKFLNIGTLEFLFILLLALIVLGPRKAVKIAGELGRWFKDLLQSQFWQDLQKTTKEIQDLPKKMMDEAEIQKTMDELDRSTAAVRRGIGRENMAKDKEQWDDSHTIYPESPPKDN
jgi:Sec-independent protein translocase protein TatA